MLKWTSFLLILILSSCAKVEIDHTNVIIILADDLGFGDLSCYGSNLNDTPNLDKMAEEGVKLSSYYAAQAVCSASRAAILTGCYPNRLGIHGAFMPKAKKGLNLSEVTIAEILKEQGYSTGTFGKWHLGDDPKFLPTMHGFDEYIGIPYSNDMWPFHPQQGPIFNFGPLPLIKQTTTIDTLTDQSGLTSDLTKYSQDFIRRNKNNPFFLYLAHPQPHVPLFVSNRFKGKSRNGLYGDVIMEIDWSVGQILNTLKDEGIDKNTLVIFTSDNGPWLSYGNHAGSAGFFREGKGTAWEGGQREPFIARFPGKITPNADIQTPMFAMDILPTIAALTGAKLGPLKIDGKDSWKILSGEQTEGLHEAFYYYYKTNELHAIRSGDWKMVFPHKYRTMFGQTAGRDGIPGNYTNVDLQKVELYNLRDDPRETRNVFKDNLNIVANMQRLATAAREELGDNLMNIEGKGNRKIGLVE